MQRDLQQYQAELIHQAWSLDALKFGSFTLKSGRSVHIFVLHRFCYLICHHSVSPYFFNAGLLSTGPVLATLATAYAATIVVHFSPDQYDVIFGPAYKGIPLAACTAMVLHSTHSIPVGFAYDRKEVKDHGEGGRMVGVSVKNKRVLILDDVMTAGTAVRAAINLVESEGGHVVGVVQCLDREEVGKGGANASSSTVHDIEQIVGPGNVQSILKMRDLIAWLEMQGGMEDHLNDMRAYRLQYGIPIVTQS
jgi:orotate phosphoribosyltransferase